MFYSTVVLIKNKTSSSSWRPAKQTYRQESGYECSFAAHFIVAGDPPMLV